MTGSEILLFIFAFTYEVIAFVYVTLYFLERKKRREAELTSELRQENVQTMHEFVEKLYGCIAVKDKLIAKQAEVIDIQKKICKSVWAERQRANAERMRLRNDVETAEKVLVKYRPDWYDFKAKRNFAIEELGVCPDEFDRLFNATEQTSCERDDTSTKCGFIKDFDVDKAIDEAIEDLDVEDLDLENIDFIKEP